ncbi:MAG: TIGR02206 family membrane protein [Flavobacteriales bacterium]|nr:TIGR02206 family membrane protein [Flavobacteriales bacterium]
MIDHFVIPPLSSIWWIGIVSSALFIFLFIRLLKNKSAIVKSNFARGLSVAFILTYIISNTIAIYNGWWNLQDNLPLHLCRISFFISMVVLLTRKQWMYEWVLFLAIPSGIHSMLTPEMTKGISTWFYFDYYFVHAGLILVPLYLTIVMGMKSRADAWWKTILRLQIPVAIILPLNFLLESNYIYLRHKPLVDNPFLIGEWPMYIVFLELIMLVHVFVIHKLAPKHI